MERRHVHHLLLRAERRQDVSYGRELLAEALRLSALPGEGMPGTLIVRRLELGTLRVGEAPDALARRIAERVRDAASGAVWYLDPRAPEAAAVWVSPEPAPAIALARHGAGAITLPLDAWHWPRLVPGFERGLDRPSVQRLAVRAIVSRPDPQPVLVELLKLLAGEGGAGRFIQQLEPAFDAALLRATGLVLPRREENPSDETVRSRRSGLERRLRAWASSPDLARLVRLAGSVVARFGPEHARSVWLCHALYLAAAQGRALDPELGRHVVELARHLARSSGVSGSSPRDRVDVVVRDRVSSPVAPAEAACEGPGGDAGGAEEALSARRAPGVSADDRAPARRGVEASGAGDNEPAPGSDAGVRRSPASAEPPPARAPRVSSSAWEAFASPQATAFGGLFFLLNVLRRLQIAPFLAQHPALADARLAVVWLARLARRLEIPVTDPVWAALETTPASAGDASFVVPGVWARELYDLSGVCRCRLDAGPGVVLITPRGAPIALYSGDPPPALAELGALSPLARREPYPAARPLDVALDAWDHAVLGWLERHSPLGLPAIVRRPGAVTLTRTHLDVIFDLESADPRVRRAALDVDLGYLPWFERVVSFFYVRGPEFGPPRAELRPASTAAS